MTKINNFLSRFNFHSTPFTREFPVKKRFPLALFDQPLIHLSRTVDKRMSASLIAPAGTGKTVILRALVEKLPQARYKINYIKVTSVSQRDLCREIANGINIKPSFELATLVRRIQECIEKRYSNNGIRSVLIFDDAHLIRPETLSLLSTLTNFEMDSELVLSVILVGQPFLGKLLQRDEMADVLYRMAYNCHLRLLSKNELNQYIKHRCHMASHSNIPFSDNSFEVLFELTQGNLRATDYLALKSLEVAHDEQSDGVNTSHVMTARSMLWT